MFNKADNRPDPLWTKSLLRVGGKEAEQKSVQPQAGSKAERFLPISAYSDLALAPRSCYFPERSISHFKYFETKEIVVPGHNHQQSCMMFKGQS